MAALLAVWADETTDMVLADEEDDEDDDELDEENDPSFLEAYDCFCSGWQPGGQMICGWATGAHGCCGVYSTAGKL